jgi:hypothetical protein
MAFRLIMPSRFLDPDLVRRQAEHRYDFSRKSLAGRVVLLPGGAGGLGAGGERPRPPPCGGVGAGGTRYGKPFARVPAKNVPAAVQALLRRYRQESAPGESFNTYVDRLGIEQFKDTIDPWTELAPRAEAPDDYLDWGATEAFKTETGPGECAA